jgi:hypothetical protein
MFNAWQLKLWIHGHWHISSDAVINGTSFIGLAGLETSDMGLSQV